MSIAGQRRLSRLVYPDTDNIGEHEILRGISDVLRPLLARLFAQRGVTAHAGSNTFIYWVEGDPTTTIAPDLYVLPRVSQTLEVPCWKLWELDGVKPALAIEIASTNWRKDYDEAPGLYAAMGCTEVVIFDPYATERSRRRVRWQHYRRDARGALRKTPVRAKDCVRVASLDLWLREVTDEHGRTRLRIATDDLGNELLPTDEEHARRATEALSAETEARRAAELEAARLRARVAELEAAARRAK